MAEPPYPPDRATWTEILANARQRLIAGAGPETLEGPRTEILQSWRRSYDDGARASGIVTPYDDNLNLASRLVRAAEPVMGRVHEDVLGSPITVVLADSKGKVLLRRSGERQLEGTLDAAMLAPGFNYAERYVGTNGIGTALEGRTASVVRGLEHFNEALQVFACVGVPVRDPVTRRQLGVLDITTWADRADPALTALARQAASVIEEGLLELSARGSRAVLDEYLVASRNREDSVVAIAEQAFIGTPDAERRLGGLGREELWPIVVDALAGRDEATVPLLTASGASIRLRMRAVRSGPGRLAGAVLQLVEAARVETPTAPATTPAPSVSPLGLAGFSGLSPVTMGPAVMVGRMAAARMPVCLVGEPGVGKRSIVASVARRELPGRTLTVVDAEQLDGDRAVDSATAAWAEGHPVLVRAADALTADSVGRLLAAVGAADAQDLEHGGWLALSLRSPSPSPLSAGDGARTALSAAGIPMVAVPPLRSRVQDLRQIVPVMLRRLGDRVHEVTPALMTRLLREPWPGNLTQVADLLAVMVRRAGSGPLDLVHLPPDFGPGLRRQLTPMEWLAREAIVEALRACGGDKALAAESLGISRASIYRKIKAYDIDPAAL